MFSFNFKRKETKGFTKSGNKIGLLLSNEKIWNKLKDQSLEKKKKEKSKN